MLAALGRGRPADAWLGPVLGITWITKLGMQRIKCPTHCNARVNGVAGGSHGVRFRPASQSVSRRHEVRDRGQAGRGRTAAGVQPVFGIPRWHFFSAAGSAASAKSKAGATGCPTFARAHSRPLSLGSANGRVRVSASCEILAVTGPWAGDDFTGQSIKRAHRKAAAGSNALGQWPTSECENPSLRWAGVDGRSVNRLFPLCRPG
jgi:hypothetical protein